MGIYGQSAVLVLFFAQKGIAMLDYGAWPRFRGLFTVLLGFSCWFFQEKFTDSITGTAISDLVAIGFMLAGACMAIGELKTRTAGTIPWNGSFTIFCSGFAVAVVLADIHNKLNPMFFSW